VQRLTLKYTGEELDGRLKKQGAQHRPIAGLPVPRKAPIGIGALDTGLDKNGKWK